MRDAVTREDSAKLKSSAHSLKGAAANLGATSLAKICAELESKGREGSIAGAETLLAQVEPEFRRVCAVLEANE